MAALTAQRIKTQSLGQPEDSPLQIGIAATYTIYQGSIVMVNSSGYARPGATATGMYGAGVAQHNTLEGTNGSDRYDNSAGANADIDVRCSSGVFGPFDNPGGGDAIADDDRGKMCWIVDDQTVALTSNAGARSPAGWVHKVDSDGVYVYFNLMLLRAAVGESNASGITFDQSAYSTANATIAAPTGAAPAAATFAAPTTLIDNTGLANTHDDTLAATAAPAALTDNSGGAAADGIIAVIAVGGNVGAEIPDAIKELATKVNEISTLLAVMVQNSSDIAQKVIEHNTQLAALAADRAADLAAITALVADHADNKQAINSLIDALQAAGIVG